MRKINRIVLPLQTIPVLYAYIGRRRLVDYSTHPVESGGRRGVPSDYKFALAMEDISCRDYVTDAYFSVAKGMNVVPIGEVFRDTME